MAQSALRLSIVACLLVVPCAAGARQVPSPESPAIQKPEAAPAVVPAVASADADRLFTTVLRDFYGALSRKDLSACETLWHPQGPARFARNIVEAQFDFQSVKFLGLQLRASAVDAGGGRARAIVDLQVTETRTGKSYRQRRLRDFTFQQDQGTWKIWNEASGVGLEVARRLIGTPEDQRRALLASDPEIRTDDTLAGLGMEANTLRAKWKVGEALGVMRIREALARTIGNETVLAGTLVDIGLVQQFLNVLDQAESAFREARELYARVGTPLDVAQQEANLGGIAYSRQEYGPALESYRKALGPFEAGAEPSIVAGTLHSIGNCLYMLGDFEQAMASYQRSLSIHESSADRRGACSVLQAIAMVSREVGNYDAALAAYTKSGVLSAQENDPVGGAKAEHGVGEIERLVGDFGRALEHYNAALSLWDKAQDPPSKAKTQFEIGQVHALQRDFPRAVEWYKQALDLDEKARETAGVARDLGGLGGAHFAGGSFELALEEYKKSLALREALKDTEGVMWTVVHMGVLYGAMNRHAEALEAFQRALDMAESAGHAGAVCTVLALRAANELARDDIEAALSTSGKAAAIAERLEMFDALSFARLTEGKAHRRAEHKDEALSSLHAAIVALERVPTGPGNESFFDDRRAPYVAMVDFLVSERRAADAFQWSERWRTRVLATMFGGDGSAITKGLDERERDEERRLTRQVKTMIVRLRRERARAKPDPERVASGQQDVERARADRAAFRQSLFAKHPALAVLRNQVEPPSIDAAAALLDDAEASLSFVVTEARTHIVVVKHGKGADVQAASVEVTATELAARVAAMRDAVTRRDARANRLLTELGALLLDPVRETLAACRSVVIVPDAFLWGVPFEALRGSSGRYLVQDAAVAYAPSLTAVRAFRSAAASGPATSAAARRRSIVVAADPAVAPAAKARLSLLRPDGAPAAAPTTREVRSLSLLFGPASSRAFTGSQARADRVASAAASADVLHLAVPGFLTDASPLFSLLVMAPSGEGDEDQGLVPVLDAASWSGPASLAVLPHLESRGATGDSTIALSWSLLAAGAPALVTSRWAAQGAGLVSGFYRAWLAGRSASAAHASAAEALRRAMTKTIAVPGSQPADWAGLMAIGQ